MLIWRRRRCRGWKTHEAEGVVDYVHFPEKQRILFQNAVEILELSAREANFVVEGVYQTLHGGFTGHGAGEYVSPGVEVF